MSIHVYSCLFMSIHVYSCLFMSIHVYSCLFMSIHVYSCLFRSIHVYSCLFYSCLFKSWMIHTSMPFFSRYSKVLLYPEEAIDLMKRQRYRLLTLGATDSQVIFPGSESISSGNQQLDLHQLQLVTLVTVTFLTSKKSVPLSSPMMATQVMHISS